MGPLQGRGGPHPPRPVPRGPARQRGDSPRTCSGPPRPASIATSASHLAWRAGAALRGGPAKPRRGRRAAPLALSIAQQHLSLPSCQARARSANSRHCRDERWLRGPNWRRLVQATSARRGLVALGRLNRARGSSPPLREWGHPFRVPKVGTRQIQLIRHATPHLISEAAHRDGEANAESSQGSPFRESGPLVVSFGAWPSHGRCLWLGCRHAMAALLKVEERRTSLGLRDQRAKRGVALPCGAGTAQGRIDDQSRRSAFCFPPPLQSRKGHRRLSAAGQKPHAHSVRRGDQHA